VLSNQYFWVSLVETDFDYVVLEAPAFGFE
jgi:hypothetical protein